MLRPFSSLDRVITARTSAVGAFRSGENGRESDTLVFNADSARLAELPWRSIGPAVTSGRVVDLAVPEGPKEQLGKRPGDLFYVASASGGVWKTINAGTTWEPVFDRQGSSSIGDIAVAPSNLNILWVGTGEANNQRSSSWGDGGYKSENAGKTWTTRVSSGAAHRPHHRSSDNPEIVYVAAAGPLWGSAVIEVVQTIDGTHVEERQEIDDSPVSLMRSSIPPIESLRRVISARAPPYTSGGGRQWNLEEHRCGTTWTRLNRRVPKRDCRANRAGCKQRTEHSLRNDRDEGRRKRRRDREHGRKPSTAPMTSERAGSARGPAAHFRGTWVDPCRSINPDRIYFLGVPLQSRRTPVEHSDP